MCSKKEFQEFQEFSNYLKDQAQFFREENARLDLILKRLKMLNDEMRIPIDITEQLAEIKQVLVNALSYTHMSQTERLRKHNNYLSKLKVCIKIYVNINEKLSEDIKVARRELEHSQQKIGGILNFSSNQVQQLEEKAKRYENEVLKFEKKYPWLKDPMFDLPNISKEVQKLRLLKDTKEKLLKDLSIYQGLKPDISEAAQQLVQIKEQHKKIGTLLLEN